MNIQLLNTDWMNGVRSLVMIKDFFPSICVQIISEAYPASYAMGTKVIFPGIKGGRDMMLTTYPI
jgi:hypothetical protein